LERLQGKTLMPLERALRWSLVLHPHPRWTPVLALRSAMDWVAAPECAVQLVRLSPDLDLRSWCGTLTFPDARDA